MLIEITSAYNGDVQVRRFAETVLFGDTLAEKLAAPPTLEDDAPGAAIPLPGAPGRPSDLPLRRGDRPKFPAAERLGEVEAAATALHAFANHELLAMELMALALLRFPDADPAFRRDLVRTLQEEQAHLVMYVERLQGWGQPFGSRALSPYFWDALSAVDSPMAFCAAMGLTLEQANLDFAGHFAQAFEAAGDDVTARILRRVLVDEIAHVARGLRWFDRLRGDTDRWDAWVGSLPPALTPRRARGPDFAAGPRLRAGLDGDFVQRVRTYGASRGRPSDLHWLNQPAEAEDDARSRTWIRDLEATAILRASDDDVVLLERPPGRLWLARVAEAGFALPAVVASPPDSPLKLDGPVGALRPWAATAVAARRLAEFGELPQPAPPNKVADGERLRDLLVDLGPADRLLRPDALPLSARDRADVDAAIAAFRAAGYERIVFKRALGTSGRGQLRLFEPALLPAQQAWLDRSLASGPVRVEPWLPRRLDLSFQMEGAALRGVVRFQTDGTGRFQGAALERPTLGLSPDLARFWAGGGTQPGWLEDVGRKLAEALADEGASGIDAFVYQDGDRLRLHPFVERNPRVTFGRLALDLRRRLAPGCVGRWTILGPAEVRRSGAASLDALASALGLSLPLERSRGQLRQCALPTSDPAAAEQVLPMLLVAPSADALDQALACVGLG